MAAARPDLNELAAAAALSRSRKRFAVLAALSLAAVTAFVAWGRLRIGGDVPTLSVDDLGQALSAFLAVVACARAGRAAGGAYRRVWSLLAASAACWGLGELVWSGYEVVLGVAVPFPSAADAGFLVSVPLAAAAILSLPSAPGRPATRGRALLDGGTVAFALGFISWAVGMGSVYRASQSSPVALAIGLAYPAGDIVVGTLLVVAIGRAPAAHRGRLALLLCGIAANALSDSAFAFLTAGGQYGPIGRVFDAGWVAGYLMIALAAVWPEPNGHAAADEGQLGALQVAVPWIAMLAVVGIAIAIRLTGRQLDGFLLVPGGGLVVLSAGSQLLYYLDSSVLLRQSRAAEARLREREAVLNEVIDHAPQGVARVGVDLRVTNVNPRMATVLPGTAITPGTSLTELLPPEDVHRLLSDFADVDGGEQDTREADSLVALADGGNAWLHWSATAVRGTDRRIAYFVVMIENVDAVHRARVAEQAHLEGLERLNRLKSEFIAMVSHEFRTALVGIQGFSEMLREQDVGGAEVRSFATEIHHGALRMDRMITEIVDLDRIESGRSSLHLAPVDLNAIVREAVWSVALENPVKAPKTVLEPGLPPLIGDAGKLTQLVTNMLTYAAEHATGDGGIVIATERHDGEVHVVVRDHGFRILPLLGDEAAVAGAGEELAGRGLELAIARRIVEMHGGRIWVEGDRGGGSRLRFSLAIGDRGEAGRD